MVLVTVDWAQRIADLRVWVRYAALLLLVLFGLLKLLEFLIELLLEFEYKLAFLIKLLDEV